MLRLLKYHSRTYRVAAWLLTVFVGVAYAARLLLPTPEGVTLYDPVSIAISLAISAAVTAASYGVNYYLTTRKKVAPVDKGRFDDVRVTGNEYGAFIPRIYGTARVAGFIIDASEIEHDPQVTPGQPGGKGAPRPPTPDTVNHVYTTTLAIGICEGLSHIAPDFKVTRIWENVTVIYDTTVSEQGDASYEAERPGNTLTGGAIAVADADASGGTAVEVPQNGQVQFNNVLGATGGSARYEFYLKSTIVNSVELNFVGTPFTGTTGNTGGVYGLAVVSGVIPMTAGFTNTIKIKNLSATPFTIDRIIVRGTGQGTGVVNEFFDPKVLSELREDTVPVFGEIPEPDSEGVITGTILAGGRAGIRIYTGTETQNPDSALVALHGAANTPAYRGTAYVVFDSYVLNEPFIPNFTFEVQTGVLDIDVIVEDLYLVVGVPSSKLDLAALAGLAFEADEGFVISSRDQAAQWIEHLQTVFQFDLPEVDGKVKAVLRSGASGGTITGDELRGHWEGEEAPEYEVLIEDVDELALPAKVEVGYMDALLDYHNNVQHAMRLSGNAVDVQTVNLPMVLRASRARQLAETILYQRHMEARVFTFTTGPKYQRLHPGDVRTLSLTNAAHTARIVEQAWSIMGPQKFTAVRAQPSVYTQNITGASGSGYEAAVIPSPSEVKALFLDTALLRPEDAGDGTVPVVYVAATIYGEGVYRGAFAHKETPKDSGSYETRLAIDGQASIGIANGTGGTDDPTVWDRATEFGVSFYNTATLESITEQQAQDNLELNLLAIGSMDTTWYIAQFTTVTAEAPALPFRSRYVFTGLLWDRFGTGAPPAGSSFEGLDVVILDGAVRPMRVELEDWQRPRKYKFTSPGQSTADVPELDFTLQANSLKDPGPTDISGDRDDDDNLLVRWQYRGRIGQHLRDFADVPIAQEREEGIIEVVGTDRTMRAITGMALPAISDTTDGSKGATVTAGTTTPVHGRSFQSITEPGNYIEATLRHVDLNTVGLRAGVGIVTPGANWSDTSGGLLPPTAPEYAAILTYDGTAYVLGVYRFGVFVTGSSISGVTDTERVRITFSGSEIRFTRDWQSPSTPPFYVAPVVPSFPYHAFLHARGSSGDFAVVSDAKMTCAPQPATVYSEAQQIEDGITPGDPVTLRIYKANAIVGRGQFTEVTI